MNSQHVRIFLTTSHICTVYATMLAKETHQDNDIDVLFIDGSKRKQGLIDLITQTSKVYNWSLFYDFSIPTSDDHDYNPSVGKNLTRKYKNWPLIRNVYTFLLNRHYKKIDERYRNELSVQLKSFLGKDTRISFFMLTQTYLNRPLQQLFPNASINYIEHGIGDYYHVLSPQTPKGNFYCLFSESYKRFLTKNGNSAEWVRSLPKIDSFPALAEKLLNEFNKSIRPDQLEVSEKPNVFVLLEAVDMYLVKPSFWTDYLNHIFQQLKNPAHYHYLLKPHPMQSEESLIATKKHFETLGYSYTLLNQPNLINASAEVLFSIWKNKTEHVFCLFSSGCFYLSKLYAGEKITFWYSTEFMSKYLENAPPQFYKSYTESRKMNDEVFTENCKSY